MLIDRIHYNPEEIERKEGIPIRISADTENLAYVMGKKRIIFSGLRKYPLLDIEKNDLIEVQPAALQHAHHLNTLERRAFEVNFRIREIMTNQLDRGFESDCIRIRFSLLGKCAFLQMLMILLKNQYILIQRVFRECLP